MRELGRVIEARVRDRVTWRIDFGWKEGHRIRINTDRSPVTGRPRRFENRQHAETVLAEIRGAVLAGEPLDRVLDRLRGRVPAADMIATRLAAYVKDFARAVEQGRRSPNSLRELARYAREGGHFSWWSGRPVQDITTPNLREWLLWLGDRVIQGRGKRKGKRLSPKAQKNVVDLFRAFVRRLADDGVIAKAPKFPLIHVPEVQIQTIDIAEQDKVLDAITWERRGAFLACAREALRPSEVRAMDLDDFDPVKGTLRVDKTIQGARLDSRVAHTKNRTSRVKEIWDQQLREWLAWRLAQATPAARLRGEIALFTNPTARNVEKRWTVSGLEREWKRACARAGVGYLPLQQGTRHSILTRLGQELPERVLRDFSRHRDARSLDRYSKPRATRGAVVRALSQAAQRPAGPSPVHQPTSSEDVEPDSTDVPRE